MSLDLLDEEFVKFLLVQVEVAPDWIVAGEVPCQQVCHFLGMFDLQFNETFSHITVEITSGKDITRSPQNKKATFEELIILIKS